MVGNFNVAFEILRTRKRMGKNSREQIVRAHALNLRRNFLPALKAQQGQGASRSPAPAARENRRRQHGLREQLFHGSRFQELKNVRKRKTVLFPERNVEAVIRCRGLQLEIERAAK